jgi:hypothetical protein
MSFTFISSLLRLPQRSAKKKNCLLGVPPVGDRLGILSRYRQKKIAIEGKKTACSASRRLATDLAYSRALLSRFVDSSSVSRSSAAPPLVSVFALLYQ